MLDLSRIHCFAVIFGSDLKNGSGFEENNLFVRWHFLFEYGHSELIRIRSIKKPYPTLIGGSASVALFEFTVLPCKGLDPDPTNTKAFWIQLRAFRQIRARPVKIQIRIRIRNSIWKYSIDMQRTRWGASGDPVIRDLDESGQEI